MYAYAAAARRNQLVLVSNRHHLDLSLTKAAAVAAEQYGSCHHQSYFTTDQQASAIHTSSQQPR